MKNKVSTHFNAFTLKKWEKKESESCWDNVWTTGGAIPSASY